MLLAEPPTLLHRGNRIHCRSFVDREHKRPGSIEADARELTDSSASTLPGCRRHYHMCNATYIEVFNRCKAMSRNIFFTSAIIIEQNSPSLPRQQHLSNPHLVPSTDLNMHSKTLAILTTLMVAACAIPAPQTTNDQTVNDSVNVDQANQQCGNDQALSCCSEEGGSDGGLIGGILDGLLGGSCNQIPVSRMVTRVPRNKR
jgi:hypothetical protein